MSRLNKQKEFENRLKEKPLFTYSVETESFKIQVAVFADSEDLGLEALNEKYRFYTTKKIKFITKVSEVIVYESNSLQEKN